MSEHVGRRTRILAAEDDPDVHVLLELLLGASGYDVQMTRDGAGALEALRGSEPVDLLILDVAMPGEYDGLAVTREVRANPAYTALPILLLSARTQAEHIEEGMAAGATDYVIKPFDTEVLLARIGALLDA
jgi:two-component system, OmpR family, phosphate regulon response regulator PhoB